ncbi:MAG: hypothetical protein D3911_04515 [Candidatus Electrothrix sp. AW3_4]|nr:hypothetical protein [Candidatus Electrothrix gigas]
MKVIQKKSCHLLMHTVFLGLLLISLSACGSVYKRETTEKYSYEPVIKRETIENIQQPPKTGKIRRKQSK